MNKKQKADYDKAQVNMKRCNLAECGRLRFRKEYTGTGGDYEHPFCMKKDSDVSLVKSCVLWLSCACSGDVSGD